MAGYRIVARKVVPITRAEEVDAIESALGDVASISNVDEHLHRSLSLLSDRAEPDYRNAIKEAISAVEALCVMINGDSSGTLGQALKKLGSAAAVTTHPALEKAFSSLYGYTSDASGIRHALMDEPNLRFEDAKFMLVTCAAFVSYLVAKASESGITLGLASQSGNSVPTSSVPSRAA
jgi:hypothetical protein